MSTLRNELGAGKGGTRSSAISTKSRMSIASISLTKRGGVGREAHYLSRRAGRCGGGQASLGWG